MRLAGVHVAIGDVQEPGLFIGIDLVNGRKRKMPDPHTATALIEHALERGALLGVDGPGRNVIKIKPPRVFSLEHADRLVEVIDATFSRG